MREDKAMRQLIAGNWKMNGVSASLAVVDAIRLAMTAKTLSADLLVCPPATLIARAAAASAGIVAIGGQDCHAEASGAFTGDFSAEMLRDAGASAVIVGHSERRRYHRETSAQVAAKVRAAWRAGLLAIVCIGETEAERLEGGALRVCSDQLGESVPDRADAGNIAVAYEPVWAIGTGSTPSGSEIADMHRKIRTCLLERHGAPASAIRILYGGSVNSGNAGEILKLPSVDGALVGGASLRAEEFLAIAARATAAGQ
jgi:triosephosphate isomerase